MYVLNFENLKEGEGNVPPKADKTSHGIWRLYKRQFSILAKNYLEYIEKTTI